MQLVAYSAEAGGGEDRVTLLSYLGDVRMSQLGDVDGAIAAYRAALDVDRNALRVLNEVIGIYRHRDDAGGLADLLAWRADITDDVPARRADFAEVGALRERGGDLEGAIAAWRRVLDLDDADREALTALIRLVRKSGDLGELIAALTRRRARPAHPTRSATCAPRSPSSRPTRRGWCRRGRRCSIWIRATPRR